MRATILTAVHMPVSDVARFPVLSISHFTFRTADVSRGYE